MQVKEPTGNVLFGETQTFPGWLNLLMVSPILLIVGIALALGTEADRSEMLLALWIVIPLNLFLFLAFNRTRFEKMVTTDGFYYRWYPFQKKYRVIRANEISSAEIKKGPSRNYGLHWLPRYGWVHTVSDGTGLQIYRRNGKKIFFGTSESFLLERAVKEFISKNGNG